MTRSSRTVTPLIVSLLAVLALVLIVVGIPVALVVFVGWPVPSPLPTVDELGDIFAGRAPLPADYLISALALVLWIIWVQVAWATMVEVVAAARGRLATRARVMPGVQVTVGKLVAAATLIASSMGSKPVMAGALAPVAAASVDYHASPSPEEVIERVEGSSPQPYLTKPGDTWWGIAEDSLGSGTRWKEIRGLNIGRTMADGTTISASTDLLRPDWRLLLPASAQPPASAPLVSGGPPAPTTVSAEVTRNVVVKQGDTIWDIAESDLAGQAPSTPAVAAHADKIIDINRDQLNGNPDMIHPGQTLGLPGTGGAIGRVDDPPAGTEEPSVTEPPSPEAETAPAEGPTPKPAGDEPTARTTPDRSSGRITVDEAEPAAPGGAAEEPAGSGVSSFGSLAGATAESDGVATPAPTPSPTTVPVTGDRDYAAPAPDAEVPSGTEQPFDDNTSGAYPATGSDVDLPVDDIAPRVPSIGPLDEADDNARGESDGETALASGNGSADAAPLSTTDSRGPVIVGLAALTLLGGYLHRARGRRRRTALRHRHPGKRPQPPKKRTKTISRRLAAAAGPEHPEFVNIGLRALSRQLRKVPARRLPEIAGVWVSQNRLVVAFAEDSPRLDPPEPFTTFDDGSGWSLARSQFEPARDIAEGANGPLPLLVTLGTTTALDLALTTSSRGPADAYGMASSLLFAVDLEPARVVSIAAADEATRIEALTLMALELATSETADQAEIVCVGFGHRLAGFERVIVVEDVGQIVDDLESVTGRAVYAAADASPFATRVGNGAADTWNPVVVFHATPDDPYTDTLIELANRTVGGVTAVCSYPTRVGWTLNIEGERVSCPDLPGDLARHEFTRPELDGADLIPDLFEEPEIQIDLDDEFWEPMQPVEVDRAGLTGLPAEDETSWRPMRPVTEHGPIPDLVSVADLGDPSLDDSSLDGPVIDRSLFEGNPVPVGAGAPEAEIAGDPEALWDQVSHIDADSWPDGDATPVKPLRHSVEQPPPEHRNHPATTPAARRAEPVDTPDDPVPAARPDADRSSPGRQAHTPAAAVESARAFRPGRQASPSPSPAAPAAAPDVAPESTPPVDGDTAVRVSVLGTLTIEGHHVGDRRKPWKYTKTPELILYLLLHPDGASQDLLMERLFPEQPPNRPRLNQLVSDARTKALGLNADGEYHLPHASPTEPFYQLLPSVGFDLRDFAQHCANAKRAEAMQVQQREWTAALRLVRGRPFTVPHDGYEWALPEIEATIVKVEEAASALTDIAFELGDYELAVWATKQGLLTGTGYYELLAKRGRAALMLQDPEEIVRAFADLQSSLDYGGAPEEGTPDLSSHPELQDIYDQLSTGRNDPNRRP